MSEKLYNIISKVFSVPISEINDESNPETIESWDSFNGLMLISELESKFNVKFTMDEVTSAKCVNDIKNSLINATKSFSLLDSEYISNKIFLSTKLILTSLKKGKKIIFCGNGGSAADSQHLSAELVGKYLKQRKAIASISLTTDTSAITSIGNDMGYENIFSRPTKFTL